jgi:hypothetical protein
MKGRRRGGEGIGDEERGRRVVEEREKGQRKRGRRKKKEWTSLISIFNP